MKQHYNFLKTMSNGFIDENDQIHSKTNDHYKTTGRYIFANSLNQLMLIFDITQPEFESYYVFETNKNFWYLYELIKK
jgi:hypothetical protein